MEANRYLTFALTKGRLADKTLKLLNQIGIHCDEILDKESRKLIFVNEELKLRFFLAKGPDVPTYVEYGVADIGVVGKDTIMEEGRRIYEVLDLGFGIVSLKRAAIPRPRSSFPPSSVAFQDGLGAWHPRHPRHSAKT